MGGMPGGDAVDGLEEEEPEEEDDVIDVDDLTKAQEKTNDKVNSVGKDLGKVDTRIEKLLGAIETLQGMFDKNNQEIADLKSEFEKRNPTQTEKLNLRSLHQPSSIASLSGYYSITTRASSSITLSPIFTQMAVTRPAFSAARLLAIFIASNTTTVSPA